MKQKVNANVSSAPAKVPNGGHKTCQKKKNDTTQSFKGPPEMALSRGRVEIIKNAWQELLKVKLQRKTELEAKS